MDEMKEKEYVILPDSELHVMLALWTGGLLSPDDIRELEKMIGMNEEKKHE